MTKERKTSRPLTSENVLVAYKTLQDNNLVSFEPPQDALQRVESLVSTVNANYFEYAPYPTPELQAAACLYYIVKDHIFSDGNKRTAVLTMTTFCAMNDIEICLPQESMDSLVVAIEEIKGGSAENLIHVIAIVLFTKKEEL